jgi:addiction module RelE/StbE family toxin
MKEGKPVLVIRWAEEATVDFVEILDYIEQRDPSAASRLHEDIVQTVERLGFMPFLYRPGRVPGTREVVVRPNFLIVYQVGDGVIDVLRILHARRQYP